VKRLQPTRSVKGMSAANARYEVIILLR